MKLFNKEKKIIPFDEKTAPKVKKIQLDIDIELLLKGGAENYANYNDVRPVKVKLEKFLLSDTDSCKEQIKEEIAKELELLFENICQQIDNDTSNFTNEFWYNTKLQKSENI